MRAEEAALPILASLLNQQEIKIISKAPRWCGRRGALPAACRDVMALAPQPDIDSVAAVYGIDPGEPPFGK